MTFKDFLRRKPWTRNDENTRRSKEAVVKPSRGTRAAAPKEIDGNIVMELKQGPKHTRRNSKGAPQTALLPIDVNVKDVQIVEENNKKACDSVKGSCNLPTPEPEADASPTSEHSSEVSLEIPEERPVIWSNPAFHAEAASQQTGSETGKLESPPAREDVIDQEGSAEAEVPAAEENKVEAVTSEQMAVQDQVTGGEGGKVDCSSQTTEDVEQVGEGGGFVEKEGIRVEVRFSILVVQENGERTIKDCTSSEADEEDEELKEIRREMKLLSKKYAELQARQEIKHRRTLSFSQASSHVAEKVSTPSRKGYLVPAKYMQHSRQSPSGRRSLGVGEQRDSSVKRSSSIKSSFPGARGADKPTVTTGSVGRESLDGSLITQMQNLTLSTPRSATEASSASAGVRRMPWVQYKSMERGADKKLSSSNVALAAEDRALAGEDEKTNTSAEAQLLDNIKEMKARGSPSVTKKVRHVASRYNSPTWSARKRSLDPKRVSFGSSPAVMSKSRSMSSTAESPWTPSRKDELEQERNKLPKIVVRKPEDEQSPRDSGCVKRPAAANKSSFFSTEQWDHEAE